MSFSDDMKALDEILASFERGGRSIEESLSLFEEGVKLIKQCRAYLDDTKRRVALLVDENDVESEEG